MKAGDTVKATRHISRRDNRCHLQLGETATVLTVYKRTLDSPEIVNIKLPDGYQMIDIVVENDVPLKVVTP